uniref:Uncharacterized protein n=1 Tax=Nelumbo nucifera TaxID=4432 RepID=A0A822ZC11_NELNU|nr:TPA_asm: hypothetical protein HUJ06_001994 [Nelumbo nucifera]
MVELSLKLQDYLAEDKLVKVGLNPPSRSLLQKPTAEPVALATPAKDEEVLVINLVKEDQGKKSPPHQPEVTQTPKPRSNHPEANTLGGSHKEVRRIMNLWVALNKSKKVVFSEEVSKYAELQPAEVTAKAMGHLRVSKHYAAMMQAANAKVKAANAKVQAADAKAQAAESAAMECRTKLVKVVDAIRKLEAEVVVKRECIQGLRKEVEE